MNHSVLITGSSRGLGFEMVKQLLAHPSPPSVIIATCRNPDAATELMKLSKEHPNQLHILKLDVLNFDLFDNFVSKVRELVGDKGLNVLINNAGIMKGDKKTLNEYTAEDLTDTYLTNTVAPILLTKALRPLLKQAAEYHKDSPMGWNRAAIINITSFLGSVTSNTFGGFLEYRESKAALNMASRSIALELGPENIIVLNMHPGWVSTDMGTSAADLTPQVSVQGMLKVFYGLKPDQHGTFHQWDGKVLPW